MKLDGMRSLAEPCYSPTIRRIARHVLPLAYMGRSVGCPCCGRTFRKFVSRFGSDELCPACLSLSRHRLFWLFLEPRLDQHDQELAVLHFAPEEGIARRLAERPRIRYVTADLNPASTAMLSFDIMAIPFDDRSFDVVICNHVLEHVDDDRRAMREIFRVLRPGGFLYSMHPVEMDLAQTVEAPEATPTERLELFGQRDHVRRYGRDFLERLHQAGLEVAVERWGEELREESRDYYRVSAREEIFVCRRAPLEQAATGPEL
jgi:SAM-dependent methyltransferase